MSSARSMSARPTSPASRAAASSPRSWRSATQSSCAASCCRAPGRRWTPIYRSWVRFVQWLVEYAPSERAFLEGFFLDIYTARAHNDGTVDQFIEEVLAFPHKQKAVDLQRYLDPLVDHDTTDRLPEITVPTLVLAGGRDPGARPELGRRVAELIPGAQFEVLDGGGPPALPGGPGRVECPRRRLLARGRGAGLKSARSEDGLRSERFRVRDPLLGARYCVGDVAGVG